MDFVKLEEVIRSALGEEYGTGHVAIYICFMQTIDLNGHFVPTEILYNGDTIELLIETNRADYDLYAKRVLVDYPRTIDDTRLTIQDPEAIYDILADHTGPSDYVKIFFSMDICGERAVSSYKLNKLSEGVYRAINKFLERKRYCIRRKGLVKAGVPLII